MAEYGLLHVTYSITQSKSLHCYDNSSVSMASSLLEESDCFEEQIGLLTALDEFKEDTHPKTG